MESKDELKNIDIKNRTSCYIDDTMAVKGVDFRDILLDIKSYRYENPTKPLWDQSCHRVKVILKRILTISSQKSELIHIIFYL